jgi:hypothetical protein
MAREAMPPKKTGDISPVEDLKPLMDEIDSILGAPPGAAGGMPPGAPGAEMPPGEMPPGLPPEMPMEEVAVGEEVTPEGDVMAEEVVEEAPGGVDVTPLVEALGIDEAKARALYDASQQLNSLEGKSPEEVATALADDFQLRMRVEKLAGEAEDIAAEEAPEVEEEVEEIEEPA